MMLFSFLQLLQVNIDKKNIILQNRSRLSLNGWYDALALACNLYTEPGFAIFGQYCEVFEDVTFVDYSNTMNTIHLPFFSNCSQPLSSEKKIINMPRSSIQPGSLHSA